MIYLVTTTPYPYGFAATKRVHLLAAGMNREIECEVIVSSRIAAKALQKENTASEGVFDGLHYRYTTKELYASPNPLKRRLGNIVDVHVTCTYLSSHLHPGDIVYLFMRDNYAERCITKTVHRLGCKCVRELCELPYVTGKETFFMKFQRFVSLNFILPQYDAIIAISESLMDVAKKYCKRTTKIIKIPILIDSSKVSDNKEQESENINLFHAGTLTQQKDGIVTIFEAIGKLKQLFGIEFPFYLTGNLNSSPEASKLKEIINKYDLKSISFLGYISNDEVERRIKESSFLILYKTKNLQNRYCFATKLGEYLNAAKVIITTDFGEQVHYLRDKENCLMVKEGDVDELVYAMKWAIEKHDDLNVIKDKARETSVYYFDYIKNTQTIIKELRRL